MPDDDTAEAPPVDSADVEGDDGAEHAVPPELLELYEVNEWQTATTPVENPAGDQ